MTSVTSGSGQLKLLVVGVRLESSRVRSYELQADDGGDLPPFTAGAHIDLHLPSGLVRSYSLCNLPSERYRYVVAVQRADVSSGGSSYLHDSVAPGDHLVVTEPRNNFALDEGTAPSVLIAGGIGITPILGMVRSLVAARRRWELHYAVRDRDDLAFARELHRLEEAGCGSGAVHVHVDADHGGTVLDLGSIVVAAPTDAHFYCCGPEPMLEEFGRVTSLVPEDQRHIELFSNPLAPDVSGGFELELASSGRVLRVASGQTILETLEQAGIAVEYSCREGICGTCSAGVLAGVPEHRDQVLTARERASNEVIMVCCSGSRSERLVLDL